MQAQVRRCIKKQEEIKEKKIKKKEKKEKWYLNEHTVKNIKKIK